MGVVKYQCAGEEEEIELLFRNKLMFTSASSLGKNKGLRPIF
jgi:hypothetical protein